MLISYNWLQEFIDIDDTPSNLAERLTMAGLEVESVTALDRGFENVVVGQITSKAPLSGSDHLTICKVDIGKETLQIVCGAPNHSDGDKVVVALTGAVLPGGLAIRKTRIRDVESNGMICSEKELEISEEAAGVIILHKDTLIGEPAAEILGRNDTVLEIDLTPNRPDALSHLGVAREVSTLTGSPLKIPNISIRESSPAVTSISSIEIQAPELCLRYLGRVMTDLSVRPSPLWMQQRLRAVGIRPINNVVDVTNYVLMEWGHPLHAFDYDLLSGQRIIVRCALRGEIMKTLDGVERKLDPSMLMICDAEKPVAVAGVMGGENTEVGDNTKRVFLEAAFFQPTSIRKTSKILGLHSESSHRFERGTDIEGMVHALDRAASLIQELAGGTISEGRMDHYPGKRLPVEITVRPDRVRSLLGIDIADEEIALIFQRLCMGIMGKNEKILVRIPTFRPDLTREVDLIEEVARIYGYNNIPSSLPQAPITLGNKTREQSLTDLVSNFLVGLGYNETIHYSFHNPEDLSALRLPEDDPLRKQIRIRNPLSEDQSALRSTLLSSLIHTLRNNIKRSLSDIRIFEIGRVFEPRESGLPHEKNRLAGIIAGKERPLLWDAPPRDLDFFDLKGDLCALFEKLGLDNVQFSSQRHLSFLHPGKSACMDYGDVRLGVMGEIHPSVLQQYDLSVRALCFEIDLDLCLRCAKEGADYVPISRFPSVERDIALILSEEIPAQEVADEIRGTSPDLIREIRFFDLYRGQPIPSGKKSLAFSIRFQAADRTLTDTEINEIRDGIVGVLNKKFQATLRE